jgi:predicted nucleotide-binding protein
MPRTKKPEVADVSSEPSMLTRFTGEAGRRRLADALSRTFLLHGVPDVERLTKQAKLLEIPTGKELMTQGATDDSIHLIVSGVFEIEVNGRYWTKREAGNHIGEASMIDPTARRNATAKALETSVVLTIPEDVFSAFANQNPDLWRRIAIELSRRLTERTKLTPVPRSEPVMFLGCSTEALGLAQEIQASMKHDIIVQIWTDGVFHPSKTVMEDLSELARNVDFAAILLTPDDKTISRHKLKMSPRDNVLLELGLMIGAIGRDRTFFIVQDGIHLKIPTDLLGINPITYSAITSPAQMSARIGPACTEMRRIVKRLGPC